MFRQRGNKKVNQLQRLGSDLYREQQQKRYFLPFFFFHDSNYKWRQRRKRCWVVVIVVGMMVVAWWSTKSTTETSTVHLPDDGTILPCTFQQLRASFPTKKQQQQQQDAAAATSSSKNDTSSCWSLEDEIIRIPMNAIVNRNSLIPLGHGYKGSVHKAILRITDLSFCSVAVKTDHCHTFGSNVFYGLSGVSCLKPYSFLWNDASYIGGEYTGALPFYSFVLQQQKGNDDNDFNTTNTGLLPTWAIIETTSKFSKLYSRLPHSWLGGSPHPNTNIVAIVMPLTTNFLPLDQVEKRNLFSNTTPSELAKLFLPAAYGLQYVHSLGLCFQDVVKNNIGIRTTTKDSSSNGEIKLFNAFLYDHSYLSLQPNNIMKNSTTKSFCKEKVFSSANYTMHRKNGKTTMESDVIGFSGIIREQFEIQYKNNKEKTNDDDTFHYKILKQKLKQCKTSMEIVETLKEII